MAAERPVFGVTPAPPTAPEPPDLPRWVVGLERPIRAFTDVTVYAATDREAIALALDPDNWNEPWESDFQDLGPPHVIHTYQLEL